MDIKQIVVQLVKKYGTNNPYKLAKLLGVVVVFEPLGSICGYYSKSHRTKVLHINESLSRKEQNFTCSHELGHAILHPDHNTAFLKKNTLFSTDRLEIEANTFSVELLLPDELLTDLEDYTIHSIFEANGIPKEFVSFKKFAKIF